MQHVERCRVVLIDDNEDVADSLAELLRLKGHEVHVALEGLEGVRAVESLRPDVMLCDLGLPDIDGFMIARLLREYHGYGTTLVAVTGFASADYEREAIDAGFDYYLMKPIDLTVLERILARAAGTRDANHVIP